eukprot:1159080-Pelagomonas_calceolata.AAC.12
MVTARVVVFVNVKDTAEGVDDHAVEAAHAPVLSNYPSHFDVAALAAGVRHASIRKGSDTTAPQIQNIGGRKCKSAGQPREKVDCRGFTILAPCKESMWRKKSMRVKGRHACRQMSS